MASLISGMDTHTPKQTGENAHTEYGISNNLDERISQLFFQLVRTDDHSDISMLHKSILYDIGNGKELQVKDILEKLNDPDGTVADEMCLRKEAFTLAGEHLKCKEYIRTMYKLLCQTRDLVGGKGEQKLAFMQLYNLYEGGHEELALSAIKHFVTIDDKHPYGSWKDIKYLCNYVKEQSKSENHPLIEKALSIMLAQLNEDMSKVESQEEGKESPSLSLAAKWMAREKSKKFGWTFKKLANLMFPEYLKTATSVGSKKKAMIKARIKLNDMLVTLSKILDVTQIKQCGKDWTNINFNSVTSATLRKQTLALTYKDKKGVVRGNDEDRIECAKKFSEHIAAAKNGSTKHKVHGQRVNVYELVKDAMTTSHISNPEKIDTINLQWVDNMKNNGALGNVIACSDTSYSMTADENVPLYNSIGLGIRISELTHPAFKDRLLTFAKEPKWHNLSNCNTFVEKVKSVSTISTGLNTDFYKALQMILNVIVENEISPEEAADLTLIILSDMQIDSAIYNDGSIDFHGAGVNYMDSMYDVITKLYADAGMKSKFNIPYTPPHILFWNLRKSMGFPVLSTQKNTSTLSGYSSALLNVLCDKGIEELKEFTPRRMLHDILSNARYSILDEDVDSFMDTN
tara:strand:+ start:18186 stop:20075 length:1890 start_codon:yes stop_codon:yes gene_type:complete